MKLRSYLLVIPLLLLNSCSGTKNLPGKLIRSGIVHYDITVESDQELMNKNFGTKAVVVFNEKLLKLSKNAEQTGFEYQMIDLQSGEEWNHLNFMGKKFRIPPDPMSTPKLAPPLRLDAHKNIAGFNCQKIKTPMGDGNMIAYVTNEIDIDYCPYLEVDGFALEYELHMPFGKVTYTATKVEEVAVTDLKMDDSYKMYRSLREFQADLSAPTTELTGRPLPDFELMDMDNKIWSPSTIKDQITVINFWFTTCAPCITEIPDLNKLKAKYAEKNIQFLAVTFDPFATVNTFLKKYPFDFTILLTGDPLIRKLEIGVYPTSIVVDKNGTIVYAESGGSFAIFDSLNEVIERTLKQ